ncbi:MAG: hypothetical protein MNPFHGCM_00484 [Gemmatimonadaceae bacterium]|nr:hypothetical protein [Gemmatimonadaceae bacterium]
MPADSAFLRSARPVLAAPATATSTLRLERSGAWWRQLWRGYRAGPVGDCFRQLEHRAPCRWGGDAIRGDRDRCAACWHRRALAQRPRQAAILLLIRAIAVGPGRSVPRRRAVIHRVFGRHIRRLPNRRARIHGERFMTCRTQAPSPKQPKVEEQETEQGGGRTTKRGNHTRQVSDANTRAESRRKQ